MIQLDKYSIFLLGSILIAGMATTGTAQARPDGAEGLRDYHSERRHHIPRRHKRQHGYGHYRHGHGHGYGHHRHGHAAYYRYDEHHHPSYHGHYHRYPDTDWPHIRLMFDF